MNESIPNLPPHSILVVDDTENCSATLEVALSPLPSLLLRFVASAEEALRALNERAFSMMITDVNLPRMDGLELLAAVRGNPRYPRMPVLVLSGDPNPETPLRAIRLGADAYFPKPYSPAAVRRKVEELLHGI